MSVLLKRRGATETLSVEPFSSLDGQSKPSYGTAVEVDCRVSEEVDHVTEPDGSRIETTLSLWVDGGEDYLPVEQDRVTRSGETFIVRRRQVRRRLSGAIDHVKLLCADHNPRRG